MKSASTGGSSSSSSSWLGRHILSVSNLAWDHPHQTLPHLQMLHAKGIRIEVAPSKVFGADWQVSHEQMESFKQLLQRMGCASPLFRRFSLVSRT